MAVSPATRRVGAARALGTRAGLVTRLRWLAGHMRLIGADMEYYGGLGPLAVHGQQLLGAAKIAESWARELQKGTAQ